MKQPAISLALLGLSLFASPALAQLSPAQEGELRGLGGAFLAAATLRDDTLARMRHLIATGREGTATGTLSLGAFDGALAPLSAPVAPDLTGDYALACHTQVQSGPPADLANAPPTRSRERLELHRDGTGGIAISFATSAATTHLQLDAVSDGRQTRLARWQYSGPEGAMDVVPIGSGALYRDDVSRAVLVPGEPHRQVIDGALQAVISGNPNWFAPQAAVALGQPWLGAETADEAFPRILALLAPMLGGSAALSGVEIVSAISGQHRLHKRDGLVVEYVGRMTLDAPGRAAPVDVALTGHEVFDLGTLARMQARFSIRLDSGTEQFALAQQQDCVFN